MARNYVKHKTAEEAKETARRQRAKWNRENYKRFSIAVTLALYERVEHHIAKNNIPSKRQYIISLIEKDLETSD